MVKQSSPVKLVGINKKDADKYINSGSFLPVSKYPENITPITGEIGGFARQHYDRVLNKKTGEFESTIDITARFVIKEEASIPLEEETEMFVLTFGTTGSAYNRK